MAMEAVDISQLPAMSPRISFSHDFIHSESIPVEQRPHSRSNSSSFDFDFCIREFPDQESSSADEIFSHGKILPLPINNKSHDDPSSASSSSSNPSPPLTRAKSEKPRLKKDPSSAKEIKPKDKQAASNSNKSFWHFKRSSSCGSGYTRSLCPLPLLSRSNSTGSTPNAKRTPLSQKQSSLRNASKNSQMGYHRPPLKKVHGLYANGLQVNPILNVHSGNLFGLASIFSSSAKDRTKKK